MNHCIRNLYFSHWNPNAKEIYKKAYLTTFQKTRRNGILGILIISLYVVIDKGEIYSNHKQNESLGSLWPWCPPANCLENGFWFDSLNEN